MSAVTKPVLVMLPAVDSVFAPTEPNCSSASRQKVRPELIEFQWRVVVTEYHLAPFQPPSVVRQG